MQDATKLVSVLINTRNRDKLIHLAMTSALKQTYKNIEIVVIDGTSTDKTKDVIEGFGDERIKYFYSSVSRMTDCWKLGLSKCNGEYIALLDDDDEWLPEKIQKQVELFNSLDDSYGWISCGGEYFDDSKGEIVGNVIPYLRGDIHEMLLKNAGIGISGGTTLMFRKDVLTSAESPIANIEYSTDFLLSLWVSKNFKFDYCDEILCIGHVNHIYEISRASKLQPTVVNINNMIEWNKYILDTYQTSFSSNPSYKYLYLRNISLLYAQLKRVDRAVIYAFLSFVVSPGRLRKNATLFMKVFKNLVKHREHP